MFRDIGPSACGLVELLEWGQVILESLLLPGTVVFLALHLRDHVLADFNFGPL